MSITSSNSSSISSCSNTPPNSLQQEITNAGLDHNLTPSLPGAGFNLFPQMRIEKSGAAPANNVLEVLVKAGLLPPLGGVPKQIESDHQMNAFPNLLVRNNNDYDTNIHHDMQKQLQHVQRKRRRLIGNMDNTLDGLVAKRADQTPLKKRYQTETEAIELPDDELEIKRMEADPDVCTRMCSICGYQGKWVSEMIRHKRVHTSSRPFKCKYCNRTSKWKADLIRHVAKTHGIRVVSKYSRSKAFDAGANNNKANGQDKNTVDGMDVDDVIELDSNTSSARDSECGSNGHASQDENNNSLPRTNNLNKTSDAHHDPVNSLFRKAQRLNSLSRNQHPQKQPDAVVPSLLSLLGLSQQLSLKMNANASGIHKNQQERQKNIYKCGICPYEQASFPLLVSHLLGAHGMSPFICQACSRPFNELVTAGEHFNTGQCPIQALKSNFVVNASAEMDVASAKDKTKLLKMGLIPLNPLNGHIGTLLPTAASFLAPALFATGAKTSFPSAASLNFPQSIADGQKCNSPGSILSTAPSYGSLVSLMSGYGGEKQNLSGADFTRDCEKLIPEESQILVPNSVKTSQKEMDANDHKATMESDTEEQNNHASAQLLDAMRDFSNSIGGINNGNFASSAFTPVVTPLAAFGQFFAELQRRTMATSIVDSHSHSGNCDC